MGKPVPRLKTMQDEILDRLDALEVTTSAHNNRIAALDEAICSRVASRLNKIEKWASKIGQMGEILENRVDDIAAEQKMLSDWVFESGVTEDLSSKLSDLEAALPHAGQDTAAMAAVRDEEWVENLGKGECIKQWTVDEVADIAVKLSPRDRLGLMYRVTDATLEDLG